MGIIRHIPNTITSMNVLCGVIGVVFTFEGRLELAFVMMLAAAVFDFFDGFAARLLGAYSEMGKELDSLCDMVSFGVLPSMMLCRLMALQTGSASLLCYAPLLIAVFSALRLAKFNIDVRQHESFIGLATPACAMICGSLCSYVQATPDSFLAGWCAGKVFIPVLTAVLCELLICELPMLSFKFKKGAPKSITTARVVFIICAVLLLALTLAFGRHWSLGVLLILCVYILMNLIFYISDRIKG